MQARPAATMCACSETEKEEEEGKKVVAVAVNVWHSARARLHHDKLGYCRCIFYNKKRSHRRTHSRSPSIFSYIACLCVFVCTVRVVFMMKS